jgi:hypothetical protein
VILVQMGGDHPAYVLGPVAQPLQRGGKLLGPVQLVFVVVEQVVCDALVVLAVLVGLAPVDASVDQNQPVLRMLDQVGVNRHDDEVLLVRGVPIESR